MDCETAAARGIADGTASAEEASAWLSQVCATREPEVIERMLQTIKAMAEER